ncbi:MAG TPA: maleylpyruvate isomerase family mycothiol-dependent enzyme [Pilimelia sp.]|nr:maleylpyruvate isomerase family mycothiol-dependent enzyme [Pilimelia sp.]
METATISTERLLQCLAADEARLRAVAARDLTAAVPSCPGWSVTDLVTHVAVTYLHKAECMRRGELPRPWPPDTSGEDPVTLLDRGYAEMTSEFVTRAPESPTYTWYDADQSVGFWVRRMAQETVIHRVDAELAAHLPITSIPDDLAVDGVDEVLERFLAFATRMWPEDFDDLLATAEGTVLVSAGGHGWLLQMAPAGVTVRRVAGSGGVVDPAGSAGSTSQVSGDPQAVLLWLWRRAGDDVIEISGDPKPVERLRALLGPATQ